MSYISRGIILIIIIIILSILMQTSQYKSFFSDSLENPIGRYKTNL